MKTGKLSSRESVLASAGHGNPRRHDRASWFASLALCAVTFAANPAVSAPGDLDTSFDFDGSTLTNIGTGSGGGQAMAIQTDGKIVVAGNSSNGTNGDVEVVRYNANGSLDTGFDGDGSATTAIGSDYDYATAVAIQSDGKIVVAGGSFNGTKRDAAVVRYNTNGSIDTSFDGDGKTTTQLGTSDDYATSIAIQGDGKIVVVGYSYPDDFGFVVARFNTDGSLDSSFDGDGKVTTAVGLNGAGFASSVAIQGDGKIVVAGNAFVGNYQDFVLVRYNKNGSLDTSFDGDGRAAADFAANYDYANAVAIQSNGKIVVAGYTGKVYDFALARFNANGSLDTSFDEDGKMTTAVGAGHDHAKSVAIQSDGKIVVAGRSQDDDKENFAIVRYSTSGSLDTGFDGDGIVTTALGERDDTATAVAIQSDGKIVAAGGSQILTGHFDISVPAVVRYTQNGSLDTAFGGDGKVTTAVGASSDFAHSVAIQGDGKIVVAGDAFKYVGFDRLPPAEFVVVRYNSNGSLDTSFGGDGKATTDFGGFGGEQEGVHSVAIQSDGKIVAAGGSQNDFAMVRYNSNGSLDTGFDGDGKVTTELGSGEFVSSIAIQGNGKIVVVGYTYTEKFHDLAVVRYNANGSLDTSFGGDGKVTTDFGARYDYADSVAIQSDGKIVVAGHSGTDSFGSADFAVVRYNTNGSLDTSFGGDGKVTTDVGANDDSAHSVAIQSDGKIVVAGGGRGDFGSLDFAMVRYNPNGSLDTSFDGDGKVTMDFGTSGASINSVAIQGNGKIVVAGYSNSEKLDDFTVARYNANGSLDRSFGVDGIATTDFGASNDIAFSVAIQPDGNFLVAGSYSGELGIDFAVVRYLGGEPEFVCGDANGDGVIRAGDALAALRNAVGVGQCEVFVCDVNGSGTVTAGDALAILKAAVGQPIELHCLGGVPVFAAQYPARAYPCQRFTSILANGSA